MKRVDLIDILVSILDSILIWKRVTGAEMSEAPVVWNEKECNENECGDKRVSCCDLNRTPEYLHRLYILAMNRI